ncbi:3-oxoacyl-ACP reductase FabG [Endozoicomonas sp. SM1973]|uniref:3-oxoacyl-ACP reductase FabG n=1 Tax=Spartinivicinus marinus TaxID=2994442 RepID=A0A853IDS5_9GAMM|nr:3-oxoacyl-ACP reductase FabG [Spartinivicinus marinus]MCX4027551.1 3-oxoacyl-ACP reductase FabG [Spartinivicinus marinus]NYZ68204.1 3-oxoacyl-ACP reductase FabG [Spartinivicinus marinus]
MFNSISGRSVVVTGGSRGIGKGMARVFAKQGAKVLIVSRGEESACQSVEEIRAQGGIAEFLLGDVSKWQDAQKIAQTANELFGGIDVLCANAGIFPQANIADMLPEHWDHVMDTNLKSLFLCVKAVLPYMKNQQKGRIVITSSITGPITGFPGWSHYGASKAGQLGFLRTAAIELAKDNITINAIMPGNIYTEGLQDLGEEYLATMASSIPLNRLGCVEDIGNTALFFAADEAGYITGQTIVVDGGQTLPE